MDYDRPIPPDETRRISVTFGMLYVLTFITSIPALYLFQPVLDDPVGYVTGAGDTNRIVLGAVLELILILANIGTAVVIYPLLKRENEGLALGYVAARIMESTFILVGILSVLAVVTLQQDATAADQRMFGSIAYTLAAIKDWTFLLGPGFVVGIGNGLLLGYLMYRSGLVPRRMAWLGLIGGPLIILSGVAVMFGVGQPGGALQGIATLPEILWELCLCIYPIVWGFRAAPLLKGTRRAAAAPPPIPPEAAPA